MDRKTSTNEKIIISMNRYITYNPKNASIIPNIINSNTL